MKKKAVTLIFTITLVTTSVFSQTVKEKMDKQIKDPKNAENSGKADVYTQKKITSDSVLIRKNDQSLLSKKKSKRKNMMSFNDSVLTSAASLCLRFIFILNQLN